MTFEELNLNKALRNALNDLGYLYATPIQQEAFPVVMSGRDVVGIAQTGTGKTFAFLLPLLRMHQFSKELHPRVLILVPTRELVLQIVGELEKLTTYMNIRIGGVYGGTNMNTQKYVVTEGLDILVATPGRLFDLAASGALNLRKVKKFVIDEVDEMLNLGFRPQLMNIMDLLSPKRQNLLFSATLTKDVEKIIVEFFQNPVKIEIEPTGTPLEKIIQSAYHVPNFYTKTNLLKLLLSKDDSLSKVLVFVSTKKMADRLFEQIKENLPEQLGIIHSNKSQNFRINSVQQFDEGNYRVLIATDIIARGLDFQDITHVINFDLSEVPENYMHRIGRTGRADNEGAAISFITEREQEFQEAIEALMKKPIPMLDLPEDLELTEKLLEEEKITYQQKNYLKAPSLKNSGGAFHEKKAKNLKTNRAQEKRMARRKEKQKSKRRKK